MKSLNKLICTVIVPATALYVACTTEDPQTSGVWVDDPAMAFDESSSSIQEVSSAEEITDLSSSAEVVSSSSSSNVKISSSSVGYGEGDITLPSGSGCKPPVPGAPAPRYAPAMVTDTATYGVIPFLTKERVKVLVSEGMPEDSAIYQARSELFRELGIDSLLEDIDVTTLQLEYTLYYLYFTNKVATMAYDLFEDYLKDDLADGKLERENYCVFEFSKLTYDEFSGLPEKYMPLGCSYMSEDIEYPTAILQNIWRKCAGMPYCNDAVGDTVITIGDDHFVCRDSAWSTLDMLDEEKGGVLCQENCAFVDAPENGDTVRYICYDGKWRSTRLAAVIVPAECFFNPDFDYGFFTDTRDGHVYRTTVYNGQIWLAQDIDYYDETDTLFSKQSMCYKNVRGLLNKVDDRSYCDGGSRYYTIDASKKACPEGWRLPTKEDWPEVNVYKDGIDVTAFFSRNSGIDGASDAYGLSLRRLGGIENNFWDLTYYNLFWLADSAAAMNDGYSNRYFNDWDAYGESSFIPVRCIKE